MYCNTRYSDILLCHVYGGSDFIASQRGWKKKSQQCALSWWVFFSRQNRVRFQKIRVSFTRTLATSIHVLFLLSLACTLRWWLCSVRALQEKSVLLRPHNHVCDFFLTPSCRSSLPVRCSTADLPRVGTGRPSSLMVVRWLQSLVFYRYSPYETERKTITWLWKVHCRANDIVRIGGQWIVRPFRIVLANRESSVIS